MAIWPMKQPCLEANLPLSAEGLTCTVHLVSWWSLEHAKRSRKNNTRGLPVTPKGTVYGFLSQARKLFSQNKQKHSSEARGKRTHAGWSLRILVNTQSSRCLLQMCYRLPPSSVSHLRPRDHSWMEARKAQDRWVCSVTERIPIGLWI